MADRTPTPAPEVLPAIPEHLRGLPVLTGGEDLVARTIERILHAETPEQALADPDAQGVRDLVGQIVILRELVGIMPSAIREGDWYVVLEAANVVTGQVITLTSGSVYVVAAAAKMHRQGWLPRPVRIVELESASNPGQSSLWLVDAARAYEEMTSAAASRRAAQQAPRAPQQHAPTVPGGDGEEPF